MSPSLFGTETLQTDRVGDVVEFLVADVFQLLALGGELFVDLDGFLGHQLVRFLGASHQCEIGPRRQPLVSVGVEADPQHDRLGPRLPFLRFGHKAKLKSDSREVKARLDVHYARRPWFWTGGGEPGKTDRPGSRAGTRR